MFALLAFYVVLLFKTKRIRGDMKAVGDRAVHGRHRRHAGLLVPPHLARRAGALIS
jgi:hypothetical protein